MSELNQPIYMHVNYLENAFAVVEIIARCADAGYAGIELRGGDATGSLPLDAYLHSTHAAAVARGLKVVYGCGNAAADADKTVREASLRKLERVIAFAADNGVELLNVFGTAFRNPALPASAYDAHGSAFASEDQWRDTVDYFQRAGDIAGPRGVRLCIEVHHTYLHDLAAPTAELLRRINRDCVQANFDYGNITFQQRNRGMKEEINCLAGRIGYVHLKNACSFRQRFDSGWFLATPLEHGDINHVVLLRELGAAGYRGVLTIENIMSGDKRRWLREDLAYLRGVMSEIATASSVG